MGDYPTHQEVVGRIPSQGGPQADRKQPRQGRYRVWIYPPLEDAMAEGGTERSGDLCLPPPEHSRTSHCKQGCYGPVPGGGAETRATGIQAVMLKGRGECEGDADGGSGGRNARKTFMQRRAVAQNGVARRGDYLGGG